MARALSKRPVVWPYNWPFKTRDRPDRVFETSKLRELYVHAEGEEWYRQHKENSIFREDFYDEQPEILVLVRFCAVNADLENFKKVLGAITEYNDSDAKFLFMLAYFLRLYLSLGVLDYNPEKVPDFARVYRAVLVHTQRIARVTPEYFIYRVKREGTVEEAVRMMLVDDQFEEAGLAEDIFSDMSVFEG